jgi:tetratricopeptide (TPR) repeat protein
VVLEYVRYKAGDQRSAHQQAINYYQSIAKQQPWYTKDDIQEYLEIFYHFYQLADYDSAFEAIWHCNDFLTLRGYYANQVELYGQLVSKWSKTNDKENWHYTASLISLGNAYNSLGQYERAIAFFQQSLDIFKEIGDIRGESDSLIGLGNGYCLLGQYERAIAFYQQSLDIKKEIGDIRGESISLNGLGNGYNSLGQYERAIAFYQKSLDIFKEIGDIRGEANAWFNLGLSLEKVDREQDALGAYRNARELYQTMGLDTDVQNCNNAIEGLSQPKKPVVSQRGFWGWLRRFWRWLRGWFRR